MMYAQNVEGLLSAKQLSEMTGLEFLQGIRDGKYPSPPIGNTLNYKLIEAELGTVTFSGKPSFAAMNPIGTVHGGWFGTLLDSCMACAVQTELAKGFGYTTLEYKINIIRPLYADSETILARGETIHVGRKTGIATGQMIGAETGKVYLVWFFQLADGSPPTCTPIIHAMSPANPSASYEVAHSVIDTQCFLKQCSRSHALC